ncbi:MAG TPA: hypothetical protein ENG87_05785 [Candidatus Pacearchaeota archaeon]|nr:hypothetical protein [Candidatus Pacearchaeota archaeon]
MRNTIIFKEFSEIPAEHKEIYGDKNRWAMRGFPNNHTINDNPYKVKNFTVHGLKKHELKKTFQDINMKMDLEGTPKNERIFFICEVFF